MPQLVHWHQALTLPGALEGSATDPESAALGPPTLAQSSQPALLSQLWLAPIFREPPHPPLRKFPGNHDQFSVAMVFPDKMYIWL